MDALMQNRVALSITLAGFAQRAGENELLPKLLPVLGTSISPELKKKITTELAFGVVACVRMPDRLILSDVWGLEGEALRQMVAMLVFSENADSRQVLENARYSSNPDEARVQVLLAIVRLVGSKDDTLIARINTEAFGKEWNGFATEFVDGSITGLKRAPRSAVIESMAGKLGLLSPRGQALIEEFLKKCAEAPAKSKAVPASQIFMDWFNEIEKRARNRKLVIRQSDSLGKYFAAETLAPVAYGLVCIRKLEGNSDFLRSVEHQELFTQGVRLLMNLYDESTKQVYLEMPKLPGLDFTIGVSKKESEEMQRNHMLKALSCISTDGSVENIGAARENLLNWFASEAKINIADAKRLVDKL